MKKTQLFLMDREFLRAMETDEVKATYNDMVELGIARAPYDAFTIQVPMGPIIRSTDESLDERAEKGDERALRLRDAPLRIEYKNQYAKGIGDIRTLVSDHTHKNWKALDSFMYENLNMYPPVSIKEHQEQMSYLATVLRSMLIVALATKGTKTTTTHNRLAKFGRGKQDYEYVTTLSIGHCVQDPTVPHSFTGLTLRPHLRRGHVKRQHYGPNNTYIKKVWIEPCFVNGYTPDSNSQRAYYNVKGPRQ